MKPKVLIAVTGCIAAYKTADVVSQLVKADCDVRVIMTPAATKFVGPLTFEALSQQKVLSAIFPETTYGAMDEIYPHLYPATEADVFAVVPATANTMAKLVHGLSDDIVSCSALSLKLNCKRIFCPAMNTQMWEQAVVQENAEKLVSAGWQQLGPEEGRLACGAMGYGRLSETSEIAQTILNLIA